MKSQNIQEERWLPIEGFENLYAVSDKGRVKSLRSGKVLKPGVNGQGYEWVALCKDGKIKQCSIHRLVAETFIENPNNLAQVNHISEDKRDNNVANLSWCTASQNNRHSMYKRSCKISQYSLDGEFVREWNSINDIERELGYNQSNIIQCCKGRKKTANGYRWEYADGLHQRKYNRRVAALTKDGDLIAEYKSAAEAARCLKICVISIRYCLNGTYKSANGLRFIYID